MQNPTAVSSAAVVAVSAILMPVVDSISSLMSKAR